MINASLHSSAYYSPTFGMQGMPGDTSRIIFPPIILPTSTNGTSTFASNAEHDEHDDHDRGGGFKNGLIGGHTPLQVIFISLTAVLLMMITIIGNFLVIASYRVNRRLRVINNMFLVSLACSDLIIGIVSMTLYPIYMITRKWWLGPVLCDIWLCLDYTLSMASVCNLMLICFDRYFSVTRPFTYRAKRTRCKTRIMIVAAWVFAFVLWSPAIVIWPLVRTRTVPDDQCYIQFFEDQIITLVTAVLAFYMPVLLMIILYSFIYIETRKCSQYLEYLRSYRKSRTSSIATPFLQLGKRANDSSVPNDSPPPCSPRSPSSFLQLDKKNDVNHNSATEHQNQNGFTDALRTRETCLDSNSCGQMGIGSETTSTEPSLTNRVKFQSGDSINGEMQTDLGESKSLHSKTLNVQNKSKEIEASEQTNTKPYGVSFHDIPTSKENNLSRKKRSDSIKMPSSEKKAGRTLSAILLAFFLTWLPYNVCAVYKAFCDQQDDCAHIPVAVWDASYYLCYINSTINPFCFALCNKTFRKTFKQILCCRKRSNFTLDFPAEKKKKKGRSANRTMISNASSSSIKSE